MSNRPIKPKPAPDKVEQRPAGHIKAKVGITSPRPEEHAAGALQPFPDRNAFGCPTDLIDPNPKGVRGWPENRAEAG